MFSVIIFGQKIVAIFSMKKICFLENFKLKKIVKKLKLWPTIHGPKFLDKKLKFWMNIRMLDKTSNFGKNPNFAHKCKF